MEYRLIKRIRQELASSSRWLPLGVWFLLMILVPIAQWTAGERGFVALTTTGVLTQVSAVLVVMASLWPASRLARVGLIVLLMGWTVEFIGQRTGFPFGVYRYTDLLQPQAGGVPLLIPLAWLMMMPPAWAIASQIGPRRNRVGFALLAGLIFTAWDLYLDPQMVAHGLWNWQQPGIYFGIPLTNFLGWWLAASLITLAAAPSDLRRQMDNSQTRALALIYTLTWLLQAIGLGMIWGQPLPALCGFLGMGIFVLLFWRKELQG